MAARPMSENVLLVLISLASSNKDAHEVLQDIHRNIGSRSNWSIGPVSATLLRLRNLDLVRFANNHHHAARRTYQLTDAGRARLRHEVDALDKIARIAQNRLAAPEAPPEPTESRQS